jgi:acyl carrier protein
MSMESAEKKVLELIAEHLGISSSDVRPEFYFKADLGADNLDVMEILMALEEEFQRDIDDDCADNIEKVQDAIDFFSSASN